MSLDNNTKINECLNYYFDYHHSILLPSLKDLYCKVTDNELRLHQAIGFNMILAHALDYLLAIEKARGLEKNKKDLMKQLDEGYAVEGGKFRNGKFLLIDAVNNSIKHIHLNNSRYKKIINEYGHMSFRLLVEKSGIIYFRTKNYQFDYGRVVLRNISEVLNFSYDDPEIIIGTLDCEPIEYCPPDYLDPSDPTTAIDRMVDYCNPVCLDCGEGEEECNCEKFLYGEENGEFSPVFDDDFDLQSTMSEIGSSWK